VAFSNTIAQTSFITQKVVDNAFRRCKLKPQQITSEDIETAYDALYMLLSELANTGVPLWCIEGLILPVYEGVKKVLLPVGTVDILNENLRTISSVDGTTANTSTTSTTTFSSDSYVTTVGVLWSAASTPIALERWDGAQWVTIQSETPDAVAGEWTWYDLSTVIAASQFRVRATTGALSFTQIVLGNNPSEIPLARMNLDDYFNLPNKDFRNSQPLQFWYDRQVPQPIMTLWPVPDGSCPARKQIVLKRHRQIMDVGTLTQELEVPQRWKKGITTSLALELGRSVPEVDPAVIPDLISARKEAMDLVWSEERDNSPTKWAPNIAMYTR
jgi:hypothetical protein